MNLADNGKLRCKAVMWEGKAIRFSKRTQICFDGSGGMGKKQPVRDVGEPLMFTYQEARLKLGVSLSQLYKLMRDGEIHSIPLGPQVRRIALTELEAYVRKVAKQAGVDPGAAA